MRFESITTVFKLLQQVNYNDGNNIRDLHDHQENLIKQIHFFLDCFIRILDLSKYYWITLTLSYLFDLCVLLRNNQLNDEFIFCLRSKRYRHSNNATNNTHLRKNNLRIEIIFVVTVTEPSFC